MGVEEIPVEDMITRGLDPGPHEQGEEEMGKPGSPSW